jgi:hypothetical protein
MHSAIVRSVRARHGRDGRDGTFVYFTHKEKGRGGHGEVRPGRVRAERVPRRRHMPSRVICAGLLPTPMWRDFNLDGNGSGSSGFGAESYSEMLANKCGSNLGYTNFASRTSRACLTIYCAGYSRVFSFALINASAGM